MVRARSLGPERWRKVEMWRSFLLLLSIHQVLVQGTSLSAEDSIKEITSCENLRDEWKPLCLAKRCIPRSVRLRKNDVLRHFFLCPHQHMSHLCLFCVRFTRLSNCPQDGGCRKPAAAGVCSTFAGALHFHLALKSSASGRARPALALTSENRPCRVPARGGRAIRPRRATAQRQPARRGRQRRAGRGGGGEPGGAAEGGADTIVSPVSVRSRAYGAAMRSCLQYHAQAHAGDICDIARQFAM